MLKDAGFHARRRHARARADLGRLARDICRPVVREPLGAGRHHGLRSPMLDLRVGGARSQELGFNALSRRRRGRTRASTNPP